MGKVNLKNIMTIVIIGILAFFSSNALFHQFSGKNISVIGTLLSIPTFLLYLYIHTSLFKKNHRK